MANVPRLNSISGDKFTFPTTEIENQETEFEFGSVTEPASPKSPADHLFYNGRLLPHSFPVQTANSLTSSMSRASSISSKDSLISSGSSSSISRTSSCGSSARTSTSTEESEQRRALQKHGKPKTGKGSYKPALVQQYGGLSQPWQFIAPAPMMKQGPRRKKSDIAAKEKKKMAGEECFCWRILKWFVWVCQKCHALEPRVSEDGLPQTLELQ